MHLLFIRCTCYLAKINPCGSTKTTPQLEPPRNPPINFEKSGHCPLFLIGWHPSLHIPGHHSLSDRQLSLDSSLPSERSLTQTPPGLFPSTPECDPSPSTGASVDSCRELCGVQLVSMKVGDDLEDVSSIDRCLKAFLN